jgi:hypothetical protein
MSDKQIDMIVTWIQLNPEIRQNKEVRKADYSSGPPTVVPVKPEPYAEPLRCYFNLNKKIARDGGKAIFGWALYTDGHLEYKAQHHAIWQSANGDLFDVTPNEVAAQQILFTADARVPFDYEKLRFPPLLNFHAGRREFWWSALKYGDLSGYALMRADKP